MSTMKHSFWARGQRSISALLGRWPDELFKMIESREGSGSRRQLLRLHPLCSGWTTEDFCLSFSSLKTAFARCLIIRNCNIEHLFICERLLMRKLLDYARTDSGFCLPSIELFSSSSSSCCSLLFTFSSFSCLTIGAATKSMFLCCELPFMFN